MEIDRKLTIFISSVIRIDELKQERLIAKKAVEELKITQPWLFEFSAASSENVQDSYLNRIQEADLFIQILEKNVTDPVINEYIKAGEVGIPRLIFIKDVKKRSKRLSAYIANINEKWKKFGTDDLFTEIQNAIIREVPKLVRVAKFRNKKFESNYYHKDKDELEIKVGEIESKNVKIAADTISNISESQKKISNSGKAKIKIQANSIKCQEDFIIAKNIKEKRKN